MLVFCQWLLAALVFSCIFIPRFSVGSVASFYRIDLRVEDLLLSGVAILTFGVITRMASFVEVPSVERAFLGFLLAAQISILNGFLFQTIDKPLVSFLYFLKWVEYFLIFVITLRLTPSSRDSDFFLKVFFLLGIAIAGYGYWEYFFPASKAVYPGYYRLFERPPFHGDANHIGGLLVLWMGFFTGLFLKTGDRRKAVWLLASLVFVFFPLVWTYSRKSYFALGAALIFPFLFRGGRRRLLFLVSLLVVLALALPTRLSERMLDLGEALSSPDPFHSSWAGNWVMWKGALWNFKQFFLFGSGLGSRHRLFYESQYVLILAETGIVGMAAFLLLGLRLVQKVLPGLRRPDTPKQAGIIFGWLIGFAGLVVHNFSCVSWTVSKISIPFWLLTACVLTKVRDP